MGVDDRTPPEPLEGAADAPPGDYSYDLAHEAPAVGEPVRSPEEDFRRRPGAEGRQPADDGGDYSYDLAHEVPPAQP